MAKFALFKNAEIMAEKKNTITNHDILKDVVILSLVDHQNNKIHLIVWLKSIFVNHESLKHIFLEELDKAIDPFQHKIGTIKFLRENPKMNLPNGVNLSDLRKLIIDEFFLSKKSIYT